MRHKLYSIFFLVFFAACQYFDYNRTQQLPKGISKVSEKKLCSFGSYEVYMIKLSKITNDSLGLWNDGLICEGYSDKPMKLQWTNVSSLSLSDKKSIAYFVDNLRSCRFNVENNLYVSACRTEYNKLNPDGIKSYNYHKLYFLDMDKSILVEVSNLD